MAKVVSIVLAAVLGTIIAARVAFNLSTASEISSAHEPWAQNKMEFLTWNGEAWTAWIREDGFELRPQNQGKWSRHSNRSLAFVDWEGHAWQAKIDGEMFLLADQGDWSGTAKSVTAIRYRDWNGEDALRTVVQLRR